MGCIPSKHTMSSPSKSQKGLAETIKTEATAAQYNLDDIYFYTFTLLV